MFTPESSMMEVELGCLDWPGYGTGMGWDQHGPTLENKCPRDSLHQFKESRKVKQKSTGNIAILSYSETLLYPPSPTYNRLSLQFSAMPSKAKVISWTESSQEQLPSLPSATCSHQQAMHHEMKLHGDLQKTTTLPQIK